ncbi:MAG: major capsid protein [Steroidobacteraceae bacterium]
MGLTLLEAAKSERDPARLAVIRELAEGELMRVIPFQDVEGEGVFYDVEQELPSVGFRGINETLDASYGVLNPQSERLKVLGAEVDVDTSIIDMRGPDAVGDQVRMKVTSMRMTFEDQFINGDESLNPRSFDGLKRRINAGSSQAINMNGALSLSALDELIDACDAMGGQKVLIMNKKMRRRLNTASRATTIGGFINYELDSFGRRVTQYGDVPIIVTDTNAQNQPVQPFTETSSSTSIYCVAMGDLLTTAIQGRCRGQFGISVRAMGEVPDAPVDRTRIEWYCGLAIYNGRSAARLYGVTDAAVVA